MTQPMVPRVLPGGVEERAPSPSEEAFFRSRPDVAGMAAEDGRVVLNPHSPLDAVEKEAVALNETARVLMRRHPALRPEFSLTPDQAAAFHGYGSLDDLRATVAARLLSGDPSTLNPTEEQLSFVYRLAADMGRLNHNSTTSI